MDRNNLFNGVIDIYFAMSKLHEKEIKVRFARERGLDGGGLKRELCNCFWSEYSAKMDGVLDHVHKCYLATRKPFTKLEDSCHIGTLLVGTSPFVYLLFQQKTFITQ